MYPQALAYRYQQTFAPHLTPPKKFSNRQTAIAATGIPALRRVRSCCSNGRQVTQRPPAPISHSGCIPLQGRGLYGSCRSACANDWRPCSRQADEHFLANSKANGNCQISQDGRPPSSKPLSTRHKGGPERLAGGNGG
ncbi:hypothetical protein CLJ1_1379 [Pseudomonas paraeruginosa]|nr:hypothetical protein CLJ1_1379 [Pseudomonas aeruginosa]